MQSFKEFITEKYAKHAARAAWQVDSKSAFIFGADKDKHAPDNDKFTADEYQLYFPLYSAKNSKIVKLDYKSIDAKHGTDFAHLRNTILKQGQDVHLSVSHLKSGVSGYHTDDKEYVTIFVTGDSLALGDEDMMSMPDGNARWLPLTEDGYGPDIFDGHISHSLYKELIWAVTKWRVKTVIDQKLNDLKLLKSKKIGGDSIKRILDGLDKVSKMEHMPTGWVDGEFSQTFPDFFHLLYMKNMFKDKPAIIKDFFDTMAPVYAKNYEAFNDTEKFSDEGIVTRYKINEIMFEGFGMAYTKGIKLMFMRNFPKILQLKDAKGKPIYDKKDLDTEDKKEHEYYGAISEDKIKGITFSYIKSKKNKEDDRVIKYRNNLFNNLKKAYPGIKVNAINDADAKRTLGFSY